MLLSKFTPPAPASPGHILIYKWPHIVIFRAILLYRNTRRYSFVFNRSTLFLISFKTYFDKEYVLSNKIIKISSDGEEWGEEVWEVRWENGKFAKNSRERERRQFLKWGGFCEGGGVGNGVKEEFFCICRSF